MPVNGFTVGRDVTITMVGANGVDLVLAPDQITNFDAKPIKKEDWSRPLNLPPKPLYLPDGWRGTVQLDRQDSSLDQFQSDYEQQYWNGENMLPGTILQTITEDDGTTTQYRFDGCMFWVEEPGQWHDGGKISQRMEFCASTRKKL